jgi:acetyl esterase/lipase
MSARAGITVDPAIFDPAAIAPDTLRFNAELEATLASTPSILDVPPQVIREARAAGRSVLGPVIRLPEAEERTIPGPGGPIPLRIMRPARARGAFLHIHGGGWTLGAHDQQDVLLKVVADSTGLAAVSVGYRLAPEYPYPAGPDDCEAAALWVAANVEREFGGHVLAIGGESAGAHLSAVTLLRLRDRHGLTPFRAANLVYGQYDFALTPSVRRWGPRNLILSTPIIERFVGWFTRPEQRADPDASPLHADLRGMPPALFTVGTLDPLLDDSLFMAARWIAAGNDAELAMYPGGIHAFNAFPIPLAAEANARALRFLVDATA